MLQRLVEVGADGVADALHVRHVRPAGELGQPVDQEAAIGGRILQLKRIEARSLARP